MDHGTVSDRRGLFQARLDLARLYASSLRQAIAHRGTFRNIHAYCMFLGYPRSGHSLVGSLLDAHPDVVVAHELNTLRYLRMGFGRGQLFALLLHRDREFTAGGRRWTGYDYNVPNQWQGRYRQLRVIGDKKGGRSSLLLESTPELLARLRRTVKIPLRVIHVVRNPFDNVATIAKRSNLPLEAAADFYFRLCRAVQATADSLRPEELLEIRYESIVRETGPSLVRLCQFLGVEPDAGYILDCASVIYPEPSRSRDRVVWDPSLVESVERRSREFPFLDGYSATSS